jgi:molybdenum cofactor biosynthesis enzyme MoaA
MTLIPVNDVCNAGCPYCGIDRTGHTPTASVRKALVQASTVGTEVTFGGGEPTLDPRLPKLLSKAGKLGLQTRQIETNGLRFSDTNFMKVVADAGLERARVMLPASDAHAWEKTTRLPGSLELAWKGISNLIDSGVIVDLVVPVSQGNVNHLADLLKRIGSDIPSVASVQLRPVFFSPDPQGRPLPNEVKALVKEHVVPPPLLASALVQALTVGEAHALKVELDLAGGLPLCSLRRSPMALQSVSGKRVTYTYADGCGDCAMFERCGGANPITTEVHGVYQTRPFHRIPPALNRNQNPEPILIFSNGMPSYQFGAGEKAEIRVVMPCNQDCTFCFVNREAPNASPDELAKAVDLAIARDVGAVVFTGGEPTLSKHLPSLVKRATAGGVPCRGIQTNALRLADKELTDRLVDAGLNHAHVSMHSSDPAEYLKITGFGTPEEAAQGIRHLASGGVELSISLVICQANAGNMRETVAFIYRQAPLARVVVAVAREQQGLTRPWDDTLVRCDRAATALGEALTCADELGLSMDVAGTCCVPPCVLDEPILKSYGRLFLMGHREANWHTIDDDDTDTAHTVSNDFAPACEECALKTRCPGITRAYLERHGESEFVPLDSERARTLSLL